MSILDITGCVALLKMNQGLSIRQSKSDSLLLAYEHFYHQPQHYQDQGSYEINSGLKRNKTATFFCGADYESSSLSQSSVDSAMLTIEELRTYNKSCATCGVSWYDEHISLDCSECGGYAMSRPCPQCDGQCNNVWRRDIDGSHNTHKAKWEGVCMVSKEGQLSSNRHQIDNDVLVKALDNLTTPL